MAKHQLTAARKKAPAKKARKRLTPLQKAHRRGWIDCRRHIATTVIDRSKELEDKCVDLALQITMQERTIARLLVLLNDKPSDELARANAEIVRLHEQLGTAPEPHA